MRLDRRSRRLREWRYLDALGRRPVGDDVARAARGGQHAHPAAFWPAAVTKQRASAQQLFDAGHPDHIELAEDGVDHRVIAGDRPGMGQGSLAAGRA